MKLIEILPNIYGVKVPLIWYDFAIDNGSNMITFKINDGFNDEVAGQTINLGQYNTFKNNFKILGTITATEISFDASEVVESTEIDVEQYDGILMAIPRFWDYELESFSCSSSDESFLSALPKEIYFENPYGKEEPKPIIHYERHDSVSSSEKLEDWQEVEEWQTAQQNITQKLLILQKTN